MASKRQRRILAPPTVVGLRCNGRNHKILLHGSQIIAINHQKDIHERDLVMKEFGTTPSPCGTQVRAWKRLWHPTKATHDMWNAFGGGSAYDQLVPKLRQAHTLMKEVQSYVRPLRHKHIVAFGTPRSKDQRLCIAFAWWLKRHRAKLKGDWDDNTIYLNNRIRSISNGIAEISHQWAALACANQAISNGYLVIAHTVDEEGLLCERVLVPVDGMPSHFQIFTFSRRENELARLR